MSNWLSRLICGWTHGGGVIKRDDVGRINWQCARCGRWADPVPLDTERRVVEAQRHASIKRILEKNSVDALNEQRREIERLRKALRYQEWRDNTQGTHSADCYKYGPMHYECALAEIARVTKNLDAYHELLMAVGNKYPNESRHKTALRYIVEAETSTGRCMKENSDG